MKEILIIMVTLFILGSTHCLSDNTNKVASKLLNKMDAKSKERVINVSETEKRNRIIYVIGESQPYTGNVVEYYKNGQKKAEYYLVNGRPSGLSIMYYNNGKKKLECTINSDDTSFTGIKMEGKVTEWYENGQKKSEYYLKDNVIEGNKTVWDEGGDITSQQTYKNGFEVSD